MRLAHVLSPTSDDRSTEQPVDLCITQARYTQLHRHINDEPRIILHLFLRQLRSSASYLGLYLHAVTRRQGHLRTIRNFAARRNTEQSVKTVTNVPGPKCYQRARLQTYEPSAGRWMPRKGGAECGAKDPGEEEGGSPGPPSLVGRVDADEEHPQASGDDGPTRVPESPMHGGYDKPQAGRDYQR